MSMKLQEYQSLDVKTEIFEPVLALHAETKFKKSGFD